MALLTPTAYWGGSSSTPPAPFGPTDIPNLVAWYDASDTTSYIKSGTTITGINSQDIYGDSLGVIGNSNPVAGTTQNGLDTLFFNGSTAFENSSTDPLVSSNGLHFAVGVFRPSNVNASRDSLWSVDSTYDYAVTAGNTSRWWGEILLGNGVGSAGAIGPHNQSFNAENTWIIVSVGFTKIQGANYIMFFVNGNVGSGANWYTTYLTNLSQNQKFRIMANRGGNKKQEGRFGEIVLYDGDWGTGFGDPADYYYRYQAEGYLAWKWGLQGNLPSWHPYKNAAP